MAIGTGGLFTPHMLVMEEYLRIQEAASRMVKDKAPLGQKLAPTLKDEFRVPVKVGLVS